MNAKTTTWLLALSCASAMAASPTVVAQEIDDPGAGPLPAPEEIVVTARQRQTMIDVVQERLDSDVVSDLLSTADISRVGDSTVSLALRRVPGVTLVNDQFIYVRGLGERFSSVQLNRAQVPSPDLTRSVLPLDIFPASIIDSLQVQKGYSPEMPAAFGGGNINIVTRSIPASPIIEFEIATGTNSDSGDTGVFYTGGGDDKFGSDDGTRALPSALSNAIQEYQGDINSASILNGLRRDGQFHTIGEAEAINRELATSLNRDFELRDKDLNPDLGLKATLGNSWYFGDKWEFGALALGSYGDKWRNRERTNRSALDPEETFFKTTRTIEEVSLTGVLNLGLDYGGDHKINTSSMFLRNTEDEASLSVGHNTNFALTDGSGLRNYRIRYEERNLRVNQISGIHRVGKETKALIPFLDKDIFERLAFEWYYSDSTAETDIPSELAFSAEDIVDPATDALQSTFIRQTASAADYRFTDLEDEVESYGWDVTKGITFGNTDVEFSTGWDYMRKNRNYQQTQFFLGTTSPSSPSVLVGTPTDVFTDANLLDPDNNFVLSVGGIGTESYLAAQITEGAYGKADVTLSDAWRVSGGVRWEQFQQATLPYDPLEFSTAVGQSQVPDDQLDSLVFQEDDFYPALSVTYSNPGFWADTFQLRFGASETVARPDLREISNAVFIDPLTEARVVGNPALVTSPITNFDIRGEWFFTNGDNFTASLFYKDIDNPIETIEGAGADDNVTLTFVNADSADITGLELEWLKGFDFLAGRVGEWANSFFISGNATFSDNEIIFGPGTTVTNTTRSMARTSDYVANIQLGFDSSNGKHSASLAFNTFGERLFFGGRNGAQDAFEQPFNSLDFNYRWYPLSGVTVQLRLQNLLDEGTEITQNNADGREVTILEQDYGTSAKLDFTWKL